MRKYIFDNSNLNESYSGVTTPLTYSFARHIYEGVYKYFCQMMGVEESLIKKNSDLFERMVEYIGGRMYYNLINWYRMIAFLPGYEFNRKFLEQMLGVEKELDYKVDAKTSFFERYFVDFPKLVVKISHIILSFLLMKKLVAAFNKKFNKVYSKVNKINLSKKNLQQLVKLYKETENKLLSGWKTPIANDFAVMISVGLAKKLSEIWLGDKNGNKINFLLGNNEDIKTTEPGFEILKILRLIHKDKKTFFFFQKAAPKEIWITLNEGCLEPTIAKLIKNYLTKFGDRAPNELKLESITFRDNPVLFIKLLKNQLKNSSFQMPEKLSPEEFVEIEKLSLLKRLAFKRILVWAKNSIVRREETRFKRGLIFGFARRIFKEIGKKLVDQGVLDEIDDVFYLTYKEIFLYIESKKQKDIKTTILGRREKAKYWKTIEMPRRIETDLTAEQYNRRFLDCRRRKTNIKVTKVTRLRSRLILKGRPASKGGVQDRLKGESLVLREFDPSRDFQNKILVTKQTDPGWTIVFPTLKALVVERGGLLSHAAVVAREFNIPCIIGVEKATTLIKDKTLIEINIIDGTIKC